MNGLADPFKQLVERKLWPIALLLVAALVAVPMLLKEDAVDARRCPAPSRRRAGVQAADASVVTARRRRPSATASAPSSVAARTRSGRPQLHRVQKADDGADRSCRRRRRQVSAGAGAGGGGGTAAAGGGGDRVAASPPRPTATPGRPRRFELYSLKVRFGSTDGELVDPQREAPDRPARRHAPRARSTSGCSRTTRRPCSSSTPASKVDRRRALRPAPGGLPDADAEAGRDGVPHPRRQAVRARPGRHQRQEDHGREGRQASRKTVAVDGRKKLKRLIGRVGALRYDEAHRRRCSEAAEGRAGQARRQDEPHRQLHLHGLRTRPRRRS